MRSTVGNIFLILAILLVGLALWSVGRDPSNSLVGLKYTLSDTALTIDTLARLVGALLPAILLGAIGVYLRRPPKRNLQTVTANSPLEPIVDSTTFSQTVAPTQSATEETTIARSAGSSRTHGEESLWADALAELEGSNRRHGLWAKVFAEANGNEATAMAAYLRERVGQLAEDIASRQAADSAQRFAAVKTNLITIARLKQAYLSGTELAEAEVELLATASESDPQLSKIADRLRGDTLLHQCARFGLLTGAETLLANGADPSASNGNGLRPYSLASEQALHTLLRRAAGGQEI